MYMRCFSKAFCTSCSDSISIKASPLRFPSLFKRKCIPFSPLRILQSKSMWVKLKPEIKLLAQLYRLLECNLPKTKSSNKTAYTNPQHWSHLTMKWSSLNLLWWSDEQTLAQKLLISWSLNANEARIHTRCITFLPILLQSVSNHLRN